MASRIDVSIRLHIHISDRRRERKGEGKGRVEIDESITLEIGIGKESGTGTGNEKEKETGLGIRGERASIVETGVDTTVVRGSIDEETTNGVARLPPTVPPLWFRMDAHRPHPCRRELTRTRKKASKWSGLVVLFSLVHVFFACVKDIAPYDAETIFSNSFRTNADRTPSSRVTTITITQVQIRARARARNGRGSI